MQVQNDLHIRINEVFREKGIEIAYPQMDLHLRSVLERMASIVAADSVAHDRKLRRELKSTMDSWEWFVNGCSRGGRECADDYAAEVRSRLRAERLLGVADERRLDVVAERDRLATIDGRLRRLFHPGVYRGPAGERDRWSGDECWWLYGAPGPPGASRTRIFPRLSTAMS